MVIINKLSKPADLARSSKQAECSTALRRILFPALPENTLFNFSAELHEKERQSEKCLLFKVIACNFTEE